MFSEKWRNPLKSSACNVWDLILNTSIKNILKEVLKKFDNMKITIFMCSFILIAYKILISYMIILLLTMLTHLIPSHG